MKNPIYQHAATPWIDLAARLYLGGIFLFASLGKLASPDDFAVSIATYQILPLSLINIMAVVMPWLELLCGAMLILGVKTRAQVLCINGMMVMFLVAIIIALSKGLKMQCGCFASPEAESDISLTTVFRDLGWLAIGLFIMFGPENTRFGLERLLRTRRGTGPTARV